MTTRRYPDDAYYRHAHDERVEPHHGLDTHMPDPDWGNVLVHPDQKKMPVGDPTLWGNTVTTVIDSDPLYPTWTPRVINGDQIVLAQAADRYARSWSLIGMVTAPQDAWNDPGPATPPGFSQKVTFADTPVLEVWLSVVVGIEKIAFEQQILLMSGNLWGLCAQQYSGNQGPYGATFTSPLAEQGQQSRSFAAIGALVGNTISVRGIYVRGGVLGSQGIVANASLAVMITPYAPGAGI